MKTSDLHKSDYKFVLETPDPNFSPERNKRIIEETIREAEITRELKMKKWREGMGERSEAVVSFLRHVDQKNGGQIESYFGSKMLAHLRGADIIDELKNKLNVISTPSPIYIQGGMVKNSKGVIVGKEVSNVKKKLQRQKELG